ncbi:MAG: glycosyltransferase family 4 protein [Cyanobacteriota bacterium]|nr:glycosyltransferase family 4 protein [Cyanobacteriota bacterium]
MRLIIGTPKWTLNGVNIFSAALVRGLRRQGTHATLLITGSLWRDQKPLPWPNDLPIEQLALPVVATWSARWRRLQTYLTAQAPCIYLPNHDVLHSAITPLLPSSIGVVGIAHSDDPQHYDHMRRLGPWCNAVVGVSHEITQRLLLMPELRHIPTCPIPYGVPINPAVDPSMTGTASTPETGLTILYAGRLEERQKRVRDLALILHSLHHQGVPAQLTIAGEGPARAALQQMFHQLGVASQVRWLGTVAPDAMAQIYRSHTVLLLPSAYEGLPLAVLEAMAYGCIPVVSAITSGIPDLVKDSVNGYCVPVGDHRGFADRLATIAQNPGQRSRMSAAARATILAGGYTLDSMVHRYQALFQEIWQDLVTHRYQRPKGRLCPPKELTWRHHLRAPLARWPSRNR